MMSDQGERRGSCCATLDAGAEPRTSEPVPGAADSRTTGAAGSNVDEMDRSGDPVERKRHEFEREALPHLDRLYSYARGYASDDNQAEDWVQDAMLKAYRSWNTYSTGTNSRAWLLTILRNTIYSHFRRDRRRQPTDFQEIEGHSVFDELQETDPEGRLFEAMVDVEVVDAISRLANPFREAVLLSDVEDLSYAEIADVTGVPIGTVRSRIHRGRKVLQRALYDYALEMGYIPAGRDRPDGDSNGES